MKSRAAFAAKNNIYTLEMYCCESLMHIDFSCFSDDCDFSQCPLNSGCINMDVNGTTCRCDDGFYKQADGNCTVLKMGFTVSVIFNIFFIFTFGGKIAFYY